MPRMQVNSQESQLFLTGIYIGMATQPIARERIGTYHPRGMEIPVVGAGVVALEWENVSRAREDLNNTLSKLIGAGLLYDANVEVLKPTYWKVYLLIPEANYFDRAKSRAVIKEITDAVDRKYKIYTDIHLHPVPEHAKRG